MFSGQRGGQSAHKSHIQNRNAPTTQETETTHEYKHKRDLERIDKRDRDSRRATTLVAKVPHVDVEEERKTEKTTATARNATRTVKLTLYAVLLQPPSFSLAPDALFRRSLSLFFSPYRALSPQSSRHITFLSTVSRFLLPGRIFRAIGPRTVPFIYTPTTHPH